MDIVLTLRAFDKIPDIDFIVLMHEAADEIERLREALQTYECTCRDNECYVDIVGGNKSCGRTAKTALKGNA